MPSLANQQRCTGGRTPPPLHNVSFILVEGIDNNAEHHSASQNWDVVSTPCGGVLHWHKGFLTPTFRRGRVTATCVRPNLTSCSRYASLTLNDDHDDDTYMLYLPTAAAVVYICAQILVVLPIVKNVFIPDINSIRVSPRQPFFRGGNKPYH